jgi:hypothetical protein
MKNMTSFGEGIGSRPCPSGGVAQARACGVMLLAFALCLLTSACGTPTGGRGWSDDDASTSDDQAATSDSLTVGDTGATQTCPATRDCRGLSCGLDPICGVSCGTCADGLRCQSGRCVMVGPTCPRDANCGGRACGADPVCGTSCGSCASETTCVNGQCQSTGPVCPRDAACGARRCGLDPVCNTSCGSCTPPQTCTADGRCICVPRCDGRVCGDDGCGGSCGSCPGGTSCQSGRCVCVGRCAGRTCGNDGCGGSCGSCPSGFSCNAAGTCDWTTARVDITCTRATFPVASAPLCGINTTAFPSMLLCDASGCDVSTFGETASYTLDRGEVHDFDVYCCLFDRLPCTAPLYDRTCDLGGSIGRVPCRCSTHRLRINGNVCGTTTIPGCV